MTAQMKSRRSLADELEATEPVDMAAAGAAVDAVALINSAIKASGVRQTDLASRIGVSEGRVSQVVNGDGNVRVSTLARFLRAAGYRLRLSAVPADRDVPPITRPRREAPRPIFVTSKTVTCLVDDGVRRTQVFEVSREHPQTFAAEKREWTKDLSTGKVTFEADEDGSAATQEGAEAEVSTTRNVDTDARN